MPVFVVPCLVGVAVLHSEAVAVALARLNSCTVTFQFRAQLPDAGLHSTAAGATFDSQCLGCEIVVLRQKSEQAHEVAVKHGVLPVLFHFGSPAGESGPFHVVGSQPIFQFLAAQKIGLHRADEGIGRMFQQILVQPPWMKNQHRTLFAAQRPRPQKTNLRTS